MKSNLDWLFIFVLPVAREMDPRVKYDAISSFDLTSASVTPASVIPPAAVSLIWMGALDKVGLAIGAPSVLIAAWDCGSNKSKTSSLKICRCKTKFKKQFSDTKNTLFSSSRENLMRCNKSQYQNREDKRNKLQFVISRQTLGLLKVTLT